MIRLATPIELEFLDSSCSSSLSHWKRTIDSLSSSSRQQYLSQRYPPPPLLKDVLQEEDNLKHYVCLAAAPHYHTRTLSKRLPKAKSPSSIYLSIYLSLSLSIYIRTYYKRRKTFKHWVQLEEMLLKMHDHHHPAHPEKKVIICI